MTLAEYVAKHGLAVKRQLQDRTGLRWQTIHDLAEGRSKARLETAKKLSEATDGECSVIELMGLDPSDLAATGS